MTSPTPQSERRRAVRALATFPVRLSQQPDGGPALLRDISENGLACTSSQSVPEMTLVGLDFSLPGAAEVHHVKGAVVRCERLPKPAGRDEASAKAGPRWDLAIYFTELAPATRAALRNYVGKAKKAP
ncbi:MAG: PilZ domain-containing protein [Planctomycetota bacterium]